MLLQPEPMQNIEREHLRAQTANAPAGHAINGPHRLPPFWHCSCGLDWSAGTHPNQSQAQAQPTEPERTLEYPYDN